MTPVSGTIARDGDARSARGEILIVGLGSPHGDDQIGWAVVERLCPRLPVGATARAVGGGLDLLACLEGQDTAIVVDAAMPSGRPGRVRVFEWPCPDLAGCRPMSTHRPGLVEALRLAEVLGRLPRRVRIYAVEAEAVQPVAALSPRAATGVDAVADAILDDLEAGIGPFVSRGGPGDA
jgi:hydrogenase maturation protease